MTYRVEILWQDGRRTVEKESHNPFDVRDAAARVSRNAAAIARVEIHDGSGPLETVWAAAWEPKP